MFCFSKLKSILLSNQPKPKTFPCSREEVTFLFKPPKQICLDQEGLKREEICNLKMVSNTNEETCSRIVELDFKKILMFHVTIILKNERL